MFRSVCYTDGLSVCHIILGEKPVRFGLKTNQKRLLKHQTLLVTNMN